MALYLYRALSKDGKKVSRTIDASSVLAVKEQLSRQGLYPISIEQVDEAARAGILTRLFAGTVSAKEKILFTKQLGILLKSDVPLLQSCELLINQFSGRMRSVLVAVKDDLKEGTSLADALEKYPKTFETLYVQLVRAGEASGQLDMILERLKDYLERQQEIRSKITGALQYPAIQLVVALLVVTALLTFVVPQIAGNFAAQGQELPTSTQIVMAISDFIVGYYPLLLVGIIGFVGSFSYWKSTPSGARILDTIKLRLPLIKYLTKTKAVVQFSSTLGMLLEGGVHLSQALDIVVQIVDNQILADALQEAKENIIKEGNISQYLKETKVFPPIALHLIATGEESGKLDEMLLNIGKTYEKEMEELIDRLTGLINPIMLVVMALIVGFIVMAIGQPIMNQGQVLDI